MSYRVSNSHEAAETRLPVAGDTPETDVWEEMPDFMADGEVKFNFVLRAPAFIPFWPEAVSPNA